MGQKHEEILARLSPMAVQTLICAQITHGTFDRYELPDRTVIEVMDELAKAELLHGRLLSVRGEVVREYAIAAMLEDLG